MSLTKLEIVESDEQNPDPIDKIIKLEMLSSFYLIFFCLVYQTLSNKAHNKTSYNKKTIKKVIRKVDFFKW